MVRFWIVFFILYGQSRSHPPQKKKRKEKLNDEYASNFANASIQKGQDIYRQHTLSLRSVAETTQRITKKISET